MNQAPRLGPSTQLFVLGVLGIISLVYTVVQLGTLPSPSRLDLSKRDAIHRVVSFIAQSVPPGKPAMLVGTFAEFGPYYVNWSLRGAWHVDSSAVVSDYASLAYPGPAPRGNIDPSPSPQYATIWSAWRGQHPNDWLVTIHMAQSSPFWTSEFGSANAWRQNYVTAIAESGERPVQTLDDASSGLLIRVYQPLPGK